MELCTTAQAVVHNSILMNLSQEKRILFGLEMVKSNLAGLFGMAFAMYPSLNHLPCMISFNKNLLPYLALAAGIMALGFSAIFVRWAAAPGPVMGFYRIGLAAAAASEYCWWEVTQNHIEISRFGHKRAQIYLFLFIYYGIMDDGLRRRP